MAAPNILNMTYMYGKTKFAAITDSATEILANAAASGKVIKINSLYIANIDGTNNTNITVDIYRSSTAYEIAHTIVVPADSTLLIIGKDGPIYLEEGDSIRATASATGDLQATISYEEIS
jgi:hypothetical protein